MGTRSVVGVINADGEKVGQYCHWDGHLDTKLPFFAKVITRDGADKVGETLMAQQQGGWSSLSASADAEADGGHLGDRSEVITGYGEAYRDADSSTPMSLETAKKEGWVEYAYFVDLREATKGDVHWHDMGRADGVLRVADFPDVDKVVSAIMAEL